MSTAIRVEDSEQGAAAQSPAKRSRPAPPRFSLRDRYSLFVGLMKVMLPAMAAALILLVVAWPHIVGKHDKFRLGIANFGADQIDNLSMLNARFDGMDDKNQPFTITADMATQSHESENLIELELPKADMTMSDGTWLALTARAGEYDRDTQLLDLTGAVSLFHDKGFELQTNSARIDFEAGTASGDEAVRGFGAAGSIQAEGFRVLDRGERILFTGRSQLTLMPEAKESVQ